MKKVVAALTERLVTSRLPAGDGTVSSLKNGRDRLVKPLTHAVMKWKPRIPKPGQGLDRARRREVFGAISDGVKKRLATPPKVLAALPPRRPAVAAALSILPGVGQLYLGQSKKGYTMLVLGLFVYPALIIIPLGVVDAFILGRRSRRGELIGAWECFWTRRPSTESIWKLSDVIKKGRAQQLIPGVEEHVIDNSRSGSTVTKTLTVTREWACTYTIEHQHDHKTVDTSTIQVRDGVTKARSVENALRNRFAYTHGSKHVYQENVEVVIPPFKKMRVLLNWKNILEVGSVVLRDQYDAGIELPFAIVIGVTFDQAQIDE